MDSELTFLWLHMRTTRVVTKVLPAWCRAGHEMCCLVGGVVTLAFLFVFHCQYVSEAACIPGLLEADPMGDNEILRVTIINKWNRTPATEEDTPIFQGIIDTVAYLRHPVSAVAYLRHPVYEFSKEKSFLLMPESVRREYGVNVHTIFLDARADCLGGVANRFVIEHAVGFDTIVVNALAAAFQGSGHVSPLHSERRVDLRLAMALKGPVGAEYLSFKFGVAVTSLFVFLTSTTVVSFTLRQSQVRMMNFTHELEHHRRNNMAYGGLITNHILESLSFVPIMVGILFFLFEFFNDQLLAFMVLAVVWICELFTLVSVRTVHSVTFFPRFFFIAFVFFLIYFFSFPLGFTYMAYWVAAAFSGYSMSYFWNNHEVPALQSGAINAAHPRQIVTVQQEVLSGQISYGAGPERRPSAGGAPGLARRHGRSVDLGQRTRAVG